MTESVILCEGYHDRALWAGWLSFLGCTDPGTPPPGKTARTRIYDPWNTPVIGGHYAFLSKSGRFIRVVPCQGKGNVLPAARLRLQERGSKPLTRLLINVDPDVPAGGTALVATGLRVQDVL